MAMIESLIWLLNGFNRILCQATCQHCLLCGLLGCQKRQVFQTSVCL